jgi:hypothetical protein
MEQIARTCSKYMYAACICSIDMYMYILVEGHTATHIQNVSLQNVSSTKRLLTKRLRNKTSPRQNVSLTKRLL